MHGVTSFNLFHFLPSFSAETGSYVDVEGPGASHYRAVRTAMHELGLMEDVIQNGGVFAPSAHVALLYSESVRLERALG